MGRPLNCGRCNKPKRPKGKNFKGLEGYCNCGRPTLMTKDVIQKLEDAFVNAMSDEQACAYAEISKQTLYNYQTENPKFVDRKQMLKMRPDIKAKQTIVAHLGDPTHAWKWTERRDPDFKPVSKIEHTVEMTEGESITMSDEEKDALEKLRIARRKRIELQAKK